MKINSITSNLFSMQSKKLLIEDEKESVFKLLVIFNYKSKYNPDFDALANIFSRDFLDERYGVSKHYTEYTAYKFLQSYLYRVCTKNELKVAELYWNTNKRNWKTPNNYICSFAPIGPFQGFTEYFNPNKPKLITHRPEQLVKGYSQYQSERKFAATLK